MKTEGKVWLIYNSVSSVQSKPMSLNQAQAVLLSIPRKQQINYFIWTPGWSEWQNVQDYLSMEQSNFAKACPPDLPNDPVNADSTVVTQSHLESSQNTVLEVLPESTATGIKYTEVFSSNYENSGISTSDYFSQDFNGHELDLSKVQKVKPPSTSFFKEKSRSNRREHPRLNFKIEVVLISDSGSFRTYSRDISLTGTQLEDEVPAHFFNSRFDLVLVNPFEPDKAKSRLLFKANIIGNIKDRRRLMFVETDRQMTLRLDTMLKAYMLHQEQLKKNKPA
jgi:hypothetical protein